MDGVPLMDNAEILREHLTERHPGAHMPWFFNDEHGGGWIEQMTVDQLTRLHAVLERQGDCHVDDPSRVARTRTLVTRPHQQMLPAGTICRLEWCRSLAARPDGLCLAHGAETKVAG